MDHDGFGRAPLLSCSVWWWQCRQRLRRRRVLDNGGAGELSRLFDDGEDSGQWRALSGKAMQDAQGGLVPLGVAIGGVTGLAGYALQSAISHARWSWTRALGQTVTGAAMGATAGPLGWIWGLNGSVAGNVLYGGADRYGW